MTFVNTLRSEKFPRDDNVDIHVNAVVLNASAPPSARLQAIEIREFIKETDIYGHGIVLPTTAIKDLIVALQRVSKDAAKEIE